MSVLLNTMLCSDPVLDRVICLWRRVFPCLLLLPGLLITSGPGFAHGSVVAEDDLCIIRIGYYQAHFKIYLPSSKGLTQYCEDLPEAGEAIFVMEYIHGALGETPMDFRIIRNVTGQGTYARLDDVNRIGDLDAVTVFHLPAESHDGVFTALHEFNETGEYLGIITAEDVSGESYAAVFPFEVGYTRFGYLPVFLVFLVASQLLFWLLKRRQTSRGLNEASE